MNSKHMRVHLKFLCDRLAVCLLLIDAIIFCYELTHRNYPEAFICLLACIPVFLSFYVISDIFKEPPVSLTPDCLSLSGKAFTYRFQNRFLFDSQSRGHVQAYVVVETDSKYIHFLNCSYVSKGITSKANPFAKGIKKAYTNKAGCEISSLRAVRGVEWDYLAFY